MNIITYRQFINRLRNYLAVEFVHLTDVKNSIDREAPMQIQRSLPVLAIIAVLFLAACNPTAAQTPTSAPTLTLAPTSTFTPAPTHTLTPIPTTPPTITVTFTATTPPPIALEGTSWVLINLGGTAALTSPQVTLTFQNGKIGGKDGCNSYGSSYTQNGSALSIDKQIISTMMACSPSSIMAQAGAFKAALTAAVAFKGDKQTLILVDASGKTLATFGH
jgi:heat shock protein HslJ